MEMNNSNPRRGYFPLIVFALLSAVLAASCSKKEEPSGMEEAARPVRVMTLQGSEHGITKMYPAKTSAKDSVDVSFEVPGKIIELPIQQGMRVEEGQILAKLDARDYENDLAAKKADFVKAQVELARYRKLYEDAAVSLEELQIRERNLNVAEAKKKIAEKAVQDTVLKAPFKGVVATTFVDNFQSVLDKAVVAKIQNSDAIQLEIDMPERDISLGGKDALGKSTARFESIPGKEFAITLKEFEAAADPVTQTFKVTFSMPNPADAEILPGMSANVVLQFAAKAGTAAASGFILPSAAVNPNAEGKPFVWIVDAGDQTVHKREVVLGPVTGTGSIQVTGGLQPGEKVALSGIYQLREGMKVQPKELGTEMTK